MSEPATKPADSPEESVSMHFDTRLPELSRWRKMQIPLIAWTVYTAIRAIGPTMRFEILGWQHAQRAYDCGEHLIGAFWHRSIFSATWWWRNRGVVVMNTTNFDGQWTRKVIERLGFGTAQGSSSRGGLKGLVVMAQRLKEGHDVAFTIDGPRGPRYVAKPGPVMLARKTGQPIFMFHVGLERATTFKQSWDLFQVPHFFTRAIAVIAPLIYVPLDASRELMERKHQEMQSSLEKVRDIAEQWFTLSEAERERIRREWNAA
jgi:lysophospholipid acyltransferase (LPLAT)-like uncharacterized protein